VQNTELRLAVNSNWTIWIFCSFTVGFCNDHSDKQCKFLGVHAALCGVVGNDS